MDNIETLETLGTKDTERRKTPPPPTNINKNETQHIPIKLKQGATHTKNTGVTPDVRDLLWHIL
jgi:hypothetical protein